MTPDIDREYEWARDRIEAFLDGDLAGEDLARFQWALEASSDLREEVAQARKLMEELRALPLRECPDRVVQRILRQTVETSRRSSAPAQRKLSLWGWPSLGFAAGVAVVIVLLSLNRGPLKGPAKAFTPAYTQAEVKKAGEQVERTLAYLAGVSARTGSAVGEEVIEASLVYPVRQTARALIETKLVSQVLPKEKEEG